MSQTDLLAILQRTGRPRVLVVGDLILDRYTWGNAQRVSQEAPVILLRADQREARPGGAANVCNMLRGLEAEVSCAGVVGDDADGRLLVQMLAQAGVDTASVILDPARPTTVKERFIGRAQGRHPHQILRVDSEVSTPLTGPAAETLADNLRELIAMHDVVLVSDYDKGVCTPRLLRLAIDAAQAAGKPLLVDPIRGSDYSRYRGATSMTPNRLEAGLATGIAIDTPDDALRAGYKLCRQLNLQFAIVTLDRDGMALVANNGSGEVFPTQPRAVYDITGAGDIVLAMIGLALASGVAPADAVRLGNVAGGLEVEKMGVAVVTRDEILARLLADRQQAAGKIATLDQLESLAAAHRASGQTIVFTNGCFDLLHVGHVTYLQEAATLGDVLVVGVNSDAGVRRLKGPSRPVIGQQDRAAMLAALACVDYVVVFDEDTPSSILTRLRPDVLVKGGTYQADQVVGREIVQSYGGRVHLARVVDGISTSGILASLGAAQTLAGPHFDAPAHSSPAGVRRTA